MRLLSVIIPTFQRQASTEAAIRSVLAQGIGDIEVIVVDDASQPPFALPDGLQHEAVRIVRHSQNLGPAAARNTGIDNASGEWISFLDSDDVLIVGTLRKRLSFARLHHKEGMPPTVYGCGFSHLTDGHSELLTRVPAAASSPEDFANGCWFCPGSAVLMLRKLALAIGPQDTNLRRLEDYDWFLRFGLMGGRLIVQPLIGALIRRGGPPAQELVRDAVNELTRKWLVGHWQLSAKAARNMRAYMQLERGVSAMRHGANVAAAIHLASSLLLAPRLTARVGGSAEVLN